MSDARIRGLLATLARAHGIQMAYYDTSHQRRTVSRAALLAALAALGAPVASERDIAPALQEWREGHWGRLVEPVAIAWDGRLSNLELRVRSNEDDDLYLHIRLEDGTEQELQLSLRRLPVTQVTGFGRSAYKSLRVDLPWALPPGYHLLVAAVAGRRDECTVISAPRRAYTRTGRRWGIFSPLYSLRSHTSWGIGDLSDLRLAIQWGADQGARFFGTLPLLAMFSEGEVSPYAPVSRLFWNELYLDIERIPDLKTCASARELIASPGFQSELAVVRQQGLVDYARVSALKRQALQALSEHFFQATAQGQTTARQRGFQDFLREQPLIAAYAHFRALAEGFGASWRAWPAQLQSGDMQRASGSTATERYHQYVQWQMQEQLAETQTAADTSGASLYLDIPVGVHAGGFDTWLHPDIFVAGASVGAPPDSFFSGGQDWGFPPLHPQRLREQRYAYYRAAMANQMRYAGIVRLDHVMGLHRLYWAPPGGDARDGVYVRYPAEEMYAVLALESHRQRCEIVGEDLGTVPRYVGAAMSRHGLYRSYVMQFALQPDRAEAIQAPPANSLASFGTHDLPTFAGFWRGLDIGQNQEQGLVALDAAADERAARRRACQALERYLRERGFLPSGNGGETSLLEACLRFLAASPARLALVNLEDLWLETQQQNRPGLAGPPNWRLRADLSLEELARGDAVIGMLRAIGGLRAEPEPV